MYKEIERKFLVKGNIGEYLPLTCIRISQGYIFQTDGGVLRVRIADDTAFLTIKSNNTDGECLEYEYPIPVKDAQHMMEHMCTHILYKKRYIKHHLNHKWEIDIFPNLLILAEVELSDINEPIHIPCWVGEEVTGQEAYFNNNILQQMVDFSHPD